MSEAEQHFDSTSAGLFTGRRGEPARQKMFSYGAPAHRYAFFSLIQFTGWKPSPSGGTASAGIPCLRTCRWRDQLLTDAAVAASGGVRPSAGFSRVATFSRSPNPPALTGGRLVSCAP